MNHLLYKPLLITSITASSFVAGCQLSLSYVSLPMILGQQDLPERTALSQYKTLFLRGFHLCPMPSIFSAVCCISNAAIIYYKHRQLTPQISRMVLAASLIIGLIPYTLAFIVPTEEKLLKKGAKLANEKQESTSIASKEETRQMMRKWNVLNYGRTLFPIAGVLVAWTLW
ncbi:hypothetical protein F4677DRAFT_433535 [Hypoxylon crocopeplum]|nr:hypothetical protein F4677DRAFT_433535 [Hypoxylon crocopeplum]